MEVYSNNFETSFTDYSSSFQSLCMFCLKCAAASTKNENTNYSNTSSINKFVKFLHRFVELDEIENNNGSVRGLECCNDCELIISSFCQEYHQLKCVELQLEWKLRKLVSIVKLANRVPSRIQQLRRMFTEFQQDESNDKTQKHNHIMENNEDKLKSFKRFRQRLVRKCSQWISKSQPRVSLERVITEGTTRTTLPLALSPLKRGDTFLPGRTTMLENMFDWLISLAAITLLSWTTTSSKQAIDEGIDDLCAELNDAISIPIEDSVCRIEMASAIKIDDDFENVKECMSQQDDNNPFLQMEQFINDKVMGSETDYDSDNRDENFDNLSADDNCLVAQPEKCDMDMDIHLNNETCKENVSLQFTEQSNFSQDTNLPKVAHSKSSSKNYQINLDRGISQGNQNLPLEIGTFTDELVARDVLMENGDGDDSDSGNRQDSFENGSHDEGCLVPHQNHNELDVEPTLKEEIIMRQQHSSPIKEEETSCQVRLETKQYNFRERRKVSYVKIELSSDQEEDSGSNSEDDAISREEKTSSLSSVSDTSEDSDDQKDTKSQRKKLSDALIKVRKRRFTKHKLNAFFCKLDGCDIKFYKNRNARAKEHMQLYHVPGQYKCNYCDVVVDKVIKLIAHEKQSHLPISNPSTNKKIIWCSRCTFKTASVHSYHWHFATTHVSGFEDKKVQGKSNFDLEEEMECKICQFVHLKKYADVHFLWYHDTANADQSKIINCTAAANCSAYFKENWQLLHHLKLTHASVFQYDQEKEKDCLELLKVMESDVEKTVYKCKLCQREYSVFGNYRAHKQKHHNSDIVKLPGNANPNCICPISSCKQIFKTLEALETHQQLHGIFTCIFCDVVKENALDLAIHETEHAKRSDDKILNRYGVAYKYHCSRCPLSFVREREFIPHFIQSHLQLSTATDTCPICMATGTSMDLSRNCRDFRSKKGHHFQIFHDTKGLSPSEIFKCQICPAYFVKSAQLTTHLVTLHYKYTCPECGKSTLAKCKDRPAKLRCHIEQAHPQIDAFPHLSFRCTWKACWCRFGTQKELDVHNAGHEASDKRQIAQVKCPECDKKFDRQDKMKLHLKKVHCPRIHMCSECGKAFKTKVVLQRHMEYHRGPDAWKFQCVTCGKKFALKEKLRDHTRTHTKEKPWVCQLCGAQYSQRHNWRNHVKKNHKKEYDEMNDGKTFRTVDSTNFMTRKGFKKGECILAK